MFTSLGQIAAEGPVSPDHMQRRGKERRTYQPVRRESHHAGREGLFWRPVSPKELDRIILAAERFELSGKLAGQRTGPLGGVALELLRLFRNLADWRTGRLDPSLDYLVMKLRRSRGAIVAALKALRHHGFVDWLRRYVPTGNEGRGPQVKQTSNAYRLSLPKRAAAMLGRYFQAAPVPDDHSHAQEQRAARIEAHRSGLTELERTMFDVDGDSPLGAALIQLAKARAVKKQREFIQQTESRSKFLFKG